jgi:membrane protease YdiL (CAAX protease family)
VPEPELGDPASPESQLPPAASHPAPPAAELPPPRSAPASILPVWATTVLVIALSWGGQLASGKVALQGSVMLDSLGFTKLSGWPIHAPLMAAASYLSWGWCLLVVWFLGCRLHRKSLTEGLAIRNPGALHWGLSLLLGLGMAAFGLFLSSKWGRTDTAIARMTSTPQGMAWIASLALPLAAAEEIYYRGFLFPRLRAGLQVATETVLPGAGKLLGGPMAAAIIVGWFGLLHLQQLIGTGAVDWLSLTVVTSAGLVFTVQRWTTGSLIPSIITHMTYNATLIGLSLLLRG